MPCPDCVDENNYEAWNRYLSNQISKLLSADTMQTKEFQEELETVRRDMEERLAHQKKQDEAAEVRKRRSCMDRPKIDYVLKGLYIGIVQPFATDAGREQEYRATACHRRIPDSCTDVPATDEIHVQTLRDRQALGVF